MFIAVIAGYVVAAVFAFCGVVQAVLFLQGCEHSMGTASFFHGLAVSLWPLAVACSIFLLTQIATMLEHLIISHSSPQQGEDRECSASARPLTPPPPPRSETYFQTCEHSESIGETFPKFSNPSETHIQQSRESSSMLPSTDTNKQDTQTPHKRELHFFRVD